MEIPALITASYRELLNTKAYKQITVADICKGAAISRNTFYKYFENKQGVTAALLREDMINPTETMKRVLNMEELKSAPKLMLEHTYQVMRDNQRAYETLLKQFGRLELIDLMVKVILSFTQPLYAGYDIQPDERMYAAYFIAASQTMIIINWIEDGMELSPTRMAKFCVNWLFAHTRELASDGLSSLPLSSSA